MTEDDLPILFEHQLDPKASRMAAFPPRDREAFMTHWRTKVLGDDAVIAKAVVVDGGVAGNVVSFESPASGKREVGYWIGREYWGRGIATRALLEFLQYEKTRPLYAGVAKHNGASIRVLEKCGFRIAQEEVAPPDTTEDDVEEVLLELE